jgi:polyphosphate kinase
MSAAVQTEKEVQSKAPAKPILPRNLRHQRRYLFNRELSWLEFNLRVLEEALDTRHPLLERLKFLAIFSSNLDEFFMVRVSGLQEALEVEAEASPDGMTPAEQLQEISTKLRPMLELQAGCLQTQILPALKKSGIIIRSYGELNNREQKAADEYFIQHVFSILTPQAVDPGHPFPYISNLSLNLGVMVGPRETRESHPAMIATDVRFARIKIPPSVPRLVPVDEKGSNFVLLDSLISANLDSLFRNMRIEQPHMFRVTRDADFDLREDEADDLMRTMQQHLRQRRFGHPARLEVVSTMPAEMTEYLMKSLELTPTDVYVLDGPLNIPDFMQLQGMDRPELKDHPLSPTVPPQLAKGSIFKAIRNQDLLLHHPYNAYSTVTDFIKTAAADEKVVAIKICLYRTGRNSAIVAALIEAVERGKQVAALVELKARFDEESNMEWARRLEEAGVHVVYGMVGLKTHCKLTLVVRREGKLLRRYLHLATGNYNPTTSKIYTDLGLLTVDEAIAEDATNLFNVLTGYSSVSNYESLLVAPVNLRKRMIKLIDRETAFAKVGRPGRIIAKVNSLTDMAIIRALYVASQYGVSIDLIVRGVCMLRPGLPRVSANIRVRSIVGRFLEHSRIFYFGNDGKEEVFIGSADWMHRNLSRRVEVVVPIKAERTRKYLKETLLSSYLKDNVNARELRSDGTYVRIEAKNKEPKFDSQLELASRS